LRRVSQVNTRVSTPRRPIGQRGKSAAAARETPPRGPRARMRKALIDAAIAISSRGIIPSVTDVAAEAQVSRATERAR